MCDRTAMTAKRKLWVEWVRILSPFSVLRSFAVTTKSKPTAIIALSRSFLWLNPTKFQPFGFTAPSVQFVSKWALTFGLKISDLKPTHPPTLIHTPTSIPFSPSFTPVGPYLSSISVQSDYTRADSANRFFGIPKNHFELPRMCVLIVDTSGGFFPVNVNCQLDPWLVEHMRRKVSAYEEVRERASVTVTSPS